MSGSLPSINDIERRALMSSFRALSLLPMVLTGWPGAEPANPDAELLRLGALFDQAAAREQAAWALANAHDDEALDDAANAANVITGAIVDQIKDCSAATLAGAMVKVRAIAWCRLGDPLDREDIGYHPLFRRGEPSTDMRLVLSTMNDLMALTGEQS